MKAAINSGKLPGLPASASAPAMGFRPGMHGHGDLARRRRDLPRPDRGAAPQPSSRPASPSRTSPRRRASPSTGSSRRCSPSIQSKLDQAVKDGKPDERPARPTSWPIYGLASTISSTASCRPGRAAPSTRLRLRFRVARRSRRAGSTDRSRPRAPGRAALRLARRSVPQGGPSRRRASRPPLARGKQPVSPVCPLPLAPRVSCGSSYARAKPGLRGVCVRRAKGVDEDRTCKRERPPRWTASPSTERPRRRRPQRSMSAGKHRA